MWLRARQEISSKRLLACTIPLQLRHLSSTYLRGQIWRDDIARPPLSSGGTTLAALGAPIVSYRNCEHVYASPAPVGAMELGARQCSACLHVQDDTRITFATTLLIATIKHAQHSTGPGGPAGPRVRPVNLRKQCDGQPCVGALRMWTLWNLSCLVDAVGPRRGYNHNIRLCSAAQVAPTIQWRRAPARQLDNL